MPEQQWSFGKVIITPEKALELEGFFGGDRRGEHVETELYARCAVCSSGGIAVIIAMDLIGLSPVWQKTARERIAEAAGTHPDAVFLGATHTHSGPLTGISEARDSSPEQPELYSDYLAELLRKLCELASDCVSRLEPAKSFYSCGRAHISSNRHAKISKAAKPISDTEVRALRVTSVDGKPLGIVVQSAAHAVLYGSESKAYCADWPGRACAELDGEFGTSLYLQGGCGDLSPLRLGSGMENCARQLGKRLSEDVRAAIKKGELACEGRVSAAGADTDLPRRPHSEEALAEAEKTRVKYAASTDPYERKFADYLAYYIKTSQSYADAGKAPPRSVYLQCINLPGCVSMLALPFEPFSAITVSLARSLRDAGRNPIVCGYSNGDHGYLPTAKAMSEGGYESQVAPLLYGMYGTWAAAAPTVVKRKLLELAGVTGVN